MTPSELPCPTCDGPLVDHCKDDDRCRWQRCRACKHTLDLPRMRAFDSTGEFINLAGPIKTDGDDAQQGGTPIDGGDDNSPGT